MWDRRDGAEVRDGRRRRERDRVDLAGADARQHFRVGGGHDGAVHGEHVDGVTGPGQTLGQDVARNLGPGEQDPCLGRIGHREPVEQRLRHEALGHEVGADAASRERARGSRADRGDAHGAERARVETRRCEPALEERVDTVRGGEDDPRVARQVGELEVDRVERDRGEFQHLGAQVLEPHPQFARLLTSARHHDPAAEQRPLLEPREVERSHVADDDRRWGLDSDLGNGRECRASRALLRAGSPVHRSDRGLGRAAAIDERARDVGQATGTHEDDERSTGARERIPVGVEGALRRVLVARDDRDAGRHTAVRHGDARVRRCRDGARDAGHDFERHLRRDACLGFLAAAPEHEGIAALQPHDHLAFAPTRHEDVVDLFLVHRGATGRFPNVDALGGRGREVQQRGRGQAVVDDDFGAAQQLFAAAGQESGIAGPGADQVHGHGATPSASSRARPPRCSSRSLAAARPTSSATRPSAWARSTT